MKREHIYRIKAYVPTWLWRGITSPYWWWYNRARHRLARVFDHRLQRSQQAMPRFHDLHKSERCFIIGNGPSLSSMDLQPLRDEFTFGMNRIYLMFPQLGFETSYYVAVNDLVLEQFAADIQGLGMPRFVSWRGRKWFTEEDGLYFLDTDYTDPANFSQDAAGRIYEGSTVTYVAMQLAYFMGFKQVILIGVDHNFETKGTPNATVVSTGADRNHFSSEYFGGGYKWQLPDLEASEAAYRMARQAFEADGREIIDATLGGKLTVFPKVDYRDLF